MFFHFPGCYLEKGGGKRKVLLREYNIDYTSGFLFRTWRFKVLTFFLTHMTIYAIKQAPAFFFHLSI